MAKQEPLIDRKKATFAAALEAVNKEFGRGAIMKLGEEPPPGIEYWPTGAASIDSILGIGGVPKGRIIEIFGPESSGKSTLAMFIVAAVQRNGGTAAYIDSENALSLTYAKGIGVDIANLALSQPEYGEQALTILEMLVASGAVDVVVVDSVAALTPRAEIEGEMGDAQMGAQARLMSQAMRKLVSIIAKTKTCVIFINQIRTNMAVSGYGPKETTSGGKALKFYSSVRLDVRRITMIKSSKGNATGNRVKIKVVKNKVAPPFRETEVDIIFGLGIDKEKDLLEFANNLGFVTRRGNSYYHNLENKGETLLGGSKAEAVNALRILAKQQPQLYNNLYQACLAEYARRENVVSPITEPEEQIEDVTEEAE